MPGVDADGYPGERLGRRGRPRAGVAVPGSGARTAAGEATASPAGPVPLAAGCGLPHEASRQASAAGQAAAANSRPRPHRACPVPVTVWLALVGAGSAAERVDVLNLSTDRPWRRAVTANIAPA